MSFEHNAKVKTLGSFITLQTCSVTIVFGMLVMLMVVASVVLKPSGLAWMAAKAGTVRRLPS